MSKLKTWTARREVKYKGSTFCSAYQMFQTLLLVLFFHILPFTTDA